VVRVNTNGANSTFSGAIQGRGVRLTKLGAGTLTLSGTNTFTSHTSLTQGTLRLTGGQALADASTVYFGSTAGNNAQLVVDTSETIGMLAGGNQENGLTTIPAGVSLTVNQTKPYSLFNGAFSGTGTFIKDGPGVMAIGNAAPTSALPNDFAGKYVLAGGVLALRNDNNDGLVSRIGADRRQHGHGL
jgi:fibronectin-binding autotransporter adhesin